MGYQRISFFLKPVGSEPLLREAIPSNGVGGHWAGVLAMTQAEVWRGGIKGGAVASLLESALGRRRYDPPHLKVTC